MTTASSNRNVADESRFVGRFRLREVVGEGAFGRVYLADDPLLGRQVALKLLVEAGGDKTRIARFLREGKAAAQLRHPNLVPVFEAGEIAGQLYLASEYVAGTSLARTLAAGRPDPRQAAEWCRQLADALGYAHDEGVIHRDVKPDNILVDEHGDVRLTDFGLAKRLNDDATVTTEGDLLGSPAYMSPEQARGESAAIGPASDQYSLGAVLYELLTGRTPFVGPSHLLIADVLQAIPTRPRAFNQRIPRDLETICLRCLSKLASERYESCHALARDLTCWLSGESIAARPASIWERAVRWMRRNPRIAAFEAAGAGLLLLIATVSFFIQAKLSSDRELIRQALMTASNERLDEQQQAAVADHQQQLANAAELDAETHAEHARREADRATALLQNLREENRQAELVRQRQVAAGTDLNRAQAAAKMEATILQQTQAKLDAATNAIRADLADDPPHQRYIKLMKFAAVAVDAKNLEQARALLDECPGDQRRWEWHYLAGRCQPDFLSFWEIKATDIPVSPGTNCGCCLAISPDGRWLVCFTNPLRPVVVDLRNRSRNPPVEAPPAHPIEANAKFDYQELKTLVVSQDSQFVAEVFGKEMTVWELSSGKIVQHRHDPDRQILAAGFDPQGRLLIASATEVPREKDGQLRPAAVLPGLRVTNGLTGEPLTDETSRVAKAVQATKCFPCEFSPNGSHLLLVGRPFQKDKYSSDKQHNVDSGAVISLETGATSAPYEATQIRFGAGDNNVLYQGSTKVDGRNVWGWKLWRFRHSLVKQFESDGEQMLLAKYPLQVSPAADRVIDGEGIWDLETQTVILPLKNPDAQFVWSADGQRIVVGLDGGIRVYTALPPAAKVPPP